MNFIHDDGAHGFQHRPALFRRQQDKQRFGRRDQNVRRTPKHLLPLGHRRVAGTHDHPQFRQQQAGSQRGLPDLAERLLQILLHIVAECFQRRDIEHLRLIPQLTAYRLLKESIDAGEKGREGLPDPVGAEISTSRPD
jgi:hypothetical protein